MGQAGPARGLPEHDETTDRVAESRPEGVSGPRYADLAPKLFDMGYEPLPLRRGEKRPAVDRWTTVPVTETQVDDWCRRFPGNGVGLRTGRLVGVDIDILDPDKAEEVAAIVRARLGRTIMRVGLWPKRVFLYRADKPFPGRKIGPFEILARGQQMAAFAVHPKTGRPYYWPDGESPMDLELDALPVGTAAQIEALIAEVADIVGPARGSARRHAAQIATGLQATRDATGLVVDGRDWWLSTVAYHVVQDALEQGDDLDAETLAAQAWARFADTTDLSRPKQDGRRSYDLGDARRKIREKLKLLADGRLPDRAQPVPPEQEPPRSDAATARAALHDALTSFAGQVEDWHRGGWALSAPRLGIRATVGLGKSSVSRLILGDLARRLKAQRLPHRILVLVPSLALADEAAASWCGSGFDAVVLRGYQATHPFTREPICQDLDGVQGAVAAGLDIQSSICFRSVQQQCAHFVGCAKQANRNAVARAEIVVAAYDAMFTGFAGDGQNFGLVVVDEACWSRSIACIDELTVEALPYLGVSAARQSRRRDAWTAATADVVAARQRLSGILADLPPGAVTASSLAGLDAAFCREARDAEWKALPPAVLVPGQGSRDRRDALVQSGNRAGGLMIIALWTALEGLLAGDGAVPGKVWLGTASDKSGQRPIRLYRLKAMAAELAGLPLLHLDATLRHELANRVLHGLPTISIEAAAPHQHVRLIRGPFKKGSLSPDKRATAEEKERRANRRAEVRDYVRWHALRHAGRRCLVITYKDLEPTFQDIPGVEVAHYNAIAGRDAWRDVTCLFLIGRPLPASEDLAEMTGALFDVVVEGAYQPVRVGLHLESGRTSSLGVVRHPDAMAERVRAAICDDEVMQALGRGRGINRGPDDPLEVHQMADVVLPIVYARVTPWENVCPDIVQQMLLAGLAVDSPGDAAALYPGLFGNEEQAKKALQRAGFGGQIPIEYSYREMSLKSARYRRGGRGRGWQRAWWIAGSDLEARGRLEGAIGPVAEWVTR